MTEHTAAPVTVFIAYAREDERLLKTLHEHLALLKRHGKIDLWHDRRIEPGQEWEAEIDQRIESFRVILLLVSSSFLDSDYCYGKELRVAMRRHEDGEARVIPIIVRPCDWSGAPFAKLQALPRDGKPITRWRSRDEAWADVAKGIRWTIESLAGEPAATATHNGAATARPPFPAEAVAKLKLYLHDDRSRIPLHDLVMGEANRICDTISRDQSYPPGPGLSGEEIAEQLPRYEELSESLMALFANGCYWGESRHHQLWVNALTQVASLPVPNVNETRPDFRINPHRYPAMLALYAGGIASVAAAQYDTLAALLVGGAVADGYGNKVPMVLGANSYRVMEIDVAKTMPGRQNARWPFNQYLCANPRLRDVVRDFLPEQADYEAKLDRFEYLLGLVCWDQYAMVYGEGWAPVSCFAWRDRNVYWDPARMPVFQQFEAEIRAERGGWPPLKAGLFNGSPDRLWAGMMAYNGSIARRALIG